MSRKIYVVEDEPIVYNAIKRIVKLDDYTPVVFTSPDIVLEQIKKEKPYLILLDIVFPDATLDGFELCEIIKNDSTLNSIPIIVMSGYAAENELKIQSGNFGADDYLEKPFNHHDLLGRIRAVVSNVYNNPGVDNTIQ